MKFMQYMWIIDLITGTILVKYLPLYLIHTLFTPHQRDLWQPMPLRQWTWVPSHTMEQLSS